jgi:hypothetical protein
MLLTERVLFIDAEALVIDKPAGLPVDPPRDGSLCVASHREQLAFGFHRWPTPVHRLDRDTSGCLLLARTERAHKRFSLAFEAGNVEKRYLAVLAGIPETTSGTIDMPLSKTSTARDGWRMVEDPKGKAAISHWRVVETRNGRALKPGEPTSFGSTPQPDSASRSQEIQFTAMVASRCGSMRYHSRWRACPSRRWQPKHQCLKGSGFNRQTQACVWPSMPSPLRSDWACG